MNKLLSLYGLKWNPFLPDVPTEALYRTPRLDHFAWRVEEPGCGRHRRGGSRR